MNRNQEYLELTQQLEEMHAPGGSVLRAMARQRKARRSKLFLRPLAGLAAAFAVFVLLVNVSPNVAQACEGIPILGALVDAVSFPRSLTKAVENDYYQKIGQKQTIDGVTLSVDNVIVDQKTVNVLFHADGENWDSLYEDGENWYLSVDAYFRLADGSDAPCAIWSSPDYVSVEFFEQDVPNVLLMDATVELSHYDPDTEETEKLEYGPYKFRLEFDPSFLAQGEHYEVDQTLELDGQRIRITGIDVYPSYTGFTVECDPTNTAWLRGLDCYLLAEDGTRFAEAEGFTGTYSENGRDLESFRMESNFFHPTGRLTLCVTGASWAEKNAETIIHLTEGTAEGLPERFEVLNCKRAGNGWEINLLETLLEADRYREPFSIIRDPNGGEHGTCCETGEYFDSESSEYSTEKAHWTYTVEDYPWDELRLTPEYTHISSFETPVTADFELN